MTAQQLSANILTGRLIVLCLTVDKQNHIYNKLEICYGRLCKEHKRVVGHVGPFNACEEGLQAGSVQP